jgi:hypothetical protein
MNTPARTNPWRIGFIILGIAVAIWISYGLVVPRMLMDWQKSSQFGDMFGGIGALFSGLALAGVVVAVLMQKEELELQREELVATREELRRSAEAQTASSEALAKQINVMQLTARINALTALAGYYHSDHYRRNYRNADIAVLVVTNRIRFLLKEAGETELQVAD